VNVDRPWRTIPSFPTVSEVCMHLLEARSLQPQGRAPSGAAGSGAGLMIVCRYLALNEVPTHDQGELRMPQQLGPG
jgi:hypothetical protein